MRVSFYPNQVACICRECGCILVDQDMVHIDELGQDMFALCVPHTVELISRLSDALQKLRLVANATT